MADTVRISIELANAAADKVLDGLTGKSEKLDQNFKKLKLSGKGTFDEISVGIGRSIGVFEIFQGNLAANIVVGTFNLMKDAASALFNVLVVDGIKAAEESESAFNDLQVALAQAGNLTPGAAQKFKEFAEQIQRNTIFEDDLIIKNAALLESLTRLDEQGLEQATLAAVQLSSALGVDLETATRAIAKGAEGNTTALKKMGLEFEESGTKAGTFKNILAAVEGQFGGNAEKKIQTFSGAIAQTKNVFGDLQEEIGNLIVKNPAIIAAINKVAEIFSSLKSTVEGNSESFSKLVGESFISIIKGAALVAEMFDLLARGAKITFGIIVELAEGAVALIAAPLSLISKEFDKVFKEATTNAKAAKDLVEENLAGGGALSKVSEKLAEIAVAAENGLGKIGTEAAKAGPVVQNLTSRTRELSEEQKRYREEVNKYVIDLAKKNDSIKEQLNQELELIRAQNEAKEAEESKFGEQDFEAKILREETYFEKKRELLEENQQLELERVNESTVSEETRQKARLEIEARYNLESEKLATERLKKIKQLKDQEVEYERQQNQYKLSATANLFSALGALAATGGKKNFEMVKAFNTAAAITNAYAAIVKTLNDGGPYPFNIVNAAAIGIQAFAQVASIQSQQAPSFESGGIVPGTSFTGDRVQANVNSGEMILNRQQQAELFEIANGRGGESNSRVEQLIGLVGQLVSQPMTIQIDGREIISVTRAQIASGRSFA